MIAFRCMTVCSVSVSRISPFLYRDILYFQYSFLYVSKGSIDIFIVIFR